MLGCISKGRLQVMHSSGSVPLWQEMPLTGHQRLACVTSLQDIYTWVIWASVFGFAIVQAILFAVLGNMSKPLRPFGTALYPGGQQQSPPSSYPATPQSSGDVVQVKQERPPADSASAAATSSMLSLMDLHVGTRIHPDVFEGW